MYLNTIHIVDTSCLNNMTDTMRSMSRRQRLSKAPEGVSTREKILTCATAVLAEDGFDRFNVQSVLDGAEVSRATLYRHFPDVDGLIEAALIETFRQELNRFQNLADELVERSTDNESFRKEVREYFETFSTIPAVFRLRRAHTFALASSRPGLAATVAEMQETVTDKWEATIQAAQDKGLFRQDLDTRAAAVMLQAIALGRIVDDTAVSHIGNERWANMYFELVDRTMMVISH
jgi:AcrR family transcriptional regulator